MGRIVFHVEVPDFAVAVERLRHRGLRTWPVLIAPPGGPRSLVLAASGEARAEGVVAGMRLGAAQRLCPRAAVLPPDRILYRRADGALTDLLGDFTPVVEIGRQGRSFLDMSGTARLHGPARDAAARLLREVGGRLRLPAAVGIAVNKAVSEVASSLIRGDLLDVLPGSEQPFLSPWEVRKLPGAAEVPDPRLFEDLNIRRIGQLAGQPAAHLAAAFGRLGPVLRQRARGVDPRPVLPPPHQPQVRQEEILAAETNESDLLAAAVRRLAERGGWRLRRRRVAAGSLGLQVGYVDDYAIEGAARLARPARDDGPLAAAAAALLRRLLRRRVRVRYLGLVLADLRPTGRQLELFPPAAAAAVAPEPDLTRALDRIRDRFGIEAIRRGAA